jgi:excisionase family DNA binding protein
MTTMIGNSTPPREERRLLTIREVSASLQVSISTIRRLIETGQLAHVRVGKQIRIRPADLEALVKFGEKRDKPHTLDFLG